MPNIYCSHSLTFLGMGENKSWVSQLILIRSCSLGEKKKTNKEVSQFFFQRKFGERKKNITGKDIVSYLLSEKWGPQGRWGKLENFLVLFESDPWNIDMGPTFRSMEHFQTNKEVKTLKHNMIFRDVSFIFVLNSSPFFFYFKNWRWEWC